MNPTFAFVALAVLALVSSAAAEEMDFALKYYSNHNMTLVYIDGKLVNPMPVTGGLMEVPVTSCSDILFILKKDTQARSSAVSAFLVHTGIEPPKANVKTYATRHVVKGLLPDIPNPGQMKPAFVSQFDPLFEATGKSPIYAIANPINVYLDADTYPPTGHIPITNIKQQIALLQRGAGVIPQSFLDTSKWITATPVDSVLTDLYPTFKPLYGHGALPLNWRDGYMRVGYYALKICNPLCYPNSHVTTIMTGCYANGVF